MERRLTAILAADVVGYSRLMGEEEVGTLARLKTCRRELFDPAIAEFQGRIIKLMGDGALVEFASVVDAVQCAAAIQRRMAGHDPAVPEARIRFRIGVNLGDVIVEETISTATGSTSPRVWRVWPSPEAFASRAPPSIMPCTRRMWGLRVSASSGSRTSPTRFASTAFCSIPAKREESRSAIWAGCANDDSGSNRGAADRPWSPSHLNGRSPLRHTGLPSRYCHSQT